MKTTILYPLLLTALLGTASCDDWFDVIPRSSVYEEDLYGREIGFQQVLTGLYTKMGESSLYGKEASFGMVDVVSGMYNLSSTSNEAYKSATQYNYEYSGTKSVMTSIWENAYNVIANANELLRNAGIRQDVAKEQTANLPQSENFTSEQTKAILCGEALAVRAYLHFDLLRMFGMTPQTNPDKPAIPYVTVLQKHVTEQSTVEEALQKVITDLLQAESLLRDNDPIVGGNPVPADNYYLPANRLVHLNYYAVCGTLARAYQYAGNPAEARKWAETVIGSQRFAWTKSSAIQKGDYVGTSELIAQLYIRDMKDRITPYFKFDSYADNSSQLLMLGDTAYDELYSPTDKRRKGFFYYQSNYLAQKYVVTEGDVSDTLSVQHRLPLMRLSEMYYIVSESYLSENNIPAATDKLNEVRKMRGLDEERYQDGASIRNELNNEYRREFIAEGQLFYYIKRTNAPDLIFSQYVVDFVFPLPESEYTYGNRQSNK